MVGKPERPTPELSSKIIEINFNPYWYVPRSIIHKDLVPKGRAFAARGQDMLAAYRMQAFDAAGNPLDPGQINWNGSEVYNYNFRQLPLGENSLGFVKINFPNKDSVYMHDTPLKSLFGKAARFESSGCVRVHNVEHAGRVDLARYAGLELRPHRLDEAQRRAVGRQAVEARPDLSGLYHWMGHARRHGAFRPRHLRDRRRLHHGLGPLMQVS